MPSLRPPGRRRWRRGRFRASSASSGAIVSANPRMFACATALAHDKIRRRLSRVPEGWRGLKGRVRGSVVYREGWMHRSRLRRGASLIGVAVVAAIFTTFATSSGSNVRAITPSPAWTADQLSAPAGNNWLEYYGDLSGDRYSSLNQITSS